MRIANITRDSIVDGPGLRLTIFTQGCPHGCPGCHNPDTHDPKGGREYALETLVQELQSARLLEGITLSGGEPFLQAAACASLAREAHARGLTVWTYTGYRYEALKQAENADWEALLAQTDVLVDGLFVESQQSYALPFRGSKNQRVILLRQTEARGQITLWQTDDGLDHFTVPSS